MENTYEHVKSFKEKYPGTIAWRLKAHSKIIDKYLNTDEKIIYAFVAQKNEHSYDIVNTNVIALTNKRLIVGTKRLLFGHFFTSITPDMFNDLGVRGGIIWGKLHIDTIKEVLEFSNISKNALPEIEEKITTQMIKEKKKYYKAKEESDK